MTNTRKGLIVAGRPWYIDIDEGLNLRGGLKENGKITLTGTGFTLAFDPFKYQGRFTETYGISVKETDSCIIFSLEADSVLLWTDSLLKPVDLK